MLKSTEPFSLETAKGCVFQREWLAARAASFSYPEGSGSKEWSQPLKPEVVLENLTVT